MMAPRTSRTGSARVSRGSLALLVVGLLACRGGGEQATGSGGQAIEGGSGGEPPSSGGSASSGGVARTGGLLVSSGGQGDGTGGSSPDGGMPSDAEVDLPGLLSTRRMDALPSYRGSLNNAAVCDTAYGLAGFEPVGGKGPHPLFLYFVGTLFVPGTPANAHDGPAPMAVTEAMARRGFVALSAQYDNGVVAWLSDHGNQLSCMFEASRPESLLSVACGLPQVDCTLGVATWGHSQGGLVAVLAHDYDDRVRAAWCTGYGGDGEPSLPRDRLRTVNGESDSSGARETMDAVAGFDRDRCAPGAVTCLRDNGSGWILVRKQDLAAPERREAGHCWFDRDSCTTDTLELEPNWVDPVSDKAFALESNADWLAAMILNAPAMR